MQDLILILSIDGFVTGAIYLLAGLGLVLIFSVTRVIFVPFGDIAVFSALTLAAFEAGRFPPIVGLLALFIILALTIEVGSLLRRGEARHIPSAIFTWGLLPSLPCAFALLVIHADLPAVLYPVAAVALIIPIAPMVARVTLQPIADASTLVLLIASLALHFLLSGLGLLFFGPEGSRTEPLIDGTIMLGPDFVVSAQTLLVLATAVALSILFFLVFQQTIVGKALRATAVNRTGARLVGIRPARTALLAYTSASLLAGLIGVLIAPLTTMYYDSGLLIGLKAFVAAIIGGLVSYPVTAIGAMAVGLVESFTSFWSGEFKDVIVFSLLIPVLIVRSFFASHSDEEEEIDS